MEEVRRYSKLIVSLEERALRIERVRGKRPVQLIFPEDGTPYIECSKLFEDGECPNVISKGTIPNDLWEAYLAGEKKPFCSLHRHWNVLPKK